VAIIPQNKKCNTPVSSQKKNLDIICSFCCVLPPIYKIREN
jgi:hypothetical protein